MAKHNEIGATGEIVAAEFLESKGHKILDRNFRRPYGEIDIVSRGRGGKIHFVEVKTVSWETGTDTNQHSPLENIHQSKIERLKRILQTYLAFKKIDSEWQFDVMAVYLDKENKTAKVRYLENIILGL